MKKTSANPLAPLQILGIQTWAEKASHAYLSKKPSENVGYAFKKTIDKIEEELIEFLREESATEEISMYRQVLFFTIRRLSLVQHSLN